MEAIKKSGKSLDEILELLNKEQGQLAPVFLIIVVAHSD